MKNAYVQSGLKRALDKITDGIYGRPKFPEGMRVRIKGKGDTGVVQRVEEPRPNEHIYHWKYKVRGEGFSEWFSEDDLEAAW